MLYKDNRRSQRLGATLFLSYSSFFILSCRGEQTKQKRKRAVSAEGEGPATAETTDPILVPSRLLRVREAWNPKYEGSLKIEKGGQGFRKGLPPLPGQDRWEGALSSKGHNQPLYLCTYTFLSRWGRAALPPANPAISEPVFPPPFNGGLINSCDSQPL